MPNFNSFVKICVEKVLILREFLKNNWQILLLEILVITVFAVFYGKFGDIVIDSYREVYISQEILNGKAIYKDIFVIYPPLAYLINAFLMKITGIHNSIILSYSGLAVTMCIVFLTYKIANIFLEKRYSLSVILFIIAALVLSPNVFNAFLPYSYGILYGILFILLSMYFSLNKKFPLSYLFYSLAILSKYEFLFLLPALIFLSRNVNLKQNILAFVTPIVLIAGTLIIQGIRLDDINVVFSLVNNMTGTKSLYWFYSVMGLTFRFSLIPVYALNILKFLCPIYWVNYQEILVWAFPIILIVSLLRYKKLSVTERFFILSSLLVSLKVFFAVTLQSYGVYFLPFVLISLCILIPNKLRKYFCALLIIWAIVIAGFQVRDLLKKKTELPHVTQYIQDNTSDNDRIVVYPEGLFINVKTNRKSDNKFYSLIPLYVETFGEDLIIRRLEITKPDYIVISNYDTSSYYFREFGKDYALKVYDWVQKNYALETTINDTWVFKIYKKLS